MFSLRSIVMIFSVLAAVAAAVTVNAADFPAKPIRVYSQVNNGAMREATGADFPDTQYITVTMDSGMSFVIGAGWSLPPAYPNFSMTWIEFIGTEGALIIDDTHRDNHLTTMKTGIVHPALRQRLRTSPP